MSGHTKAVQLDGAPNVVHRASLAQAAVARHAVVVPKPATGEPHDPHDPPAPPAASDGKGKLINTFG